MMASRMIIKKCLLCRKTIPSKVKGRCRSSIASFQHADIEIEKATQLKDKPSPDNLPFGKVFSDHMLTIKWSADSGWAKPRIGPFQNLSLHPASTVFHYAVELYEGLKAYRGEDNDIRMFRPFENMKRMLSTAERATLPLFDGGELVKCISQLVDLDRDWVPHSTSSSLYIRPCFIGTEPSLGVNNPRDATLFVILSPVGPYFKTGTFSPVSLVADIKNVRAFRGGVGNYKLGSNYGPTIYPQKSAERQGYQQILWLYGDNHQLTEVGTMNIFILWTNEKGEKELLTTPLDGLTLPGVTRKSLMELAQSWDEVKVVERPLTMPELATALRENRVHEMFGAGTACVVCPVGSIAYINENFEVPTMTSEDKLCERFFNTLMDIQYGRLDHPWSYRVGDLIKGKRAE